MPQYDESFVYDRDQKRSNKRSYCVYKSACDRNSALESLTKVFHEHGKSVLKDTKIGMHTGENKSGVIFAKSFEIVKYQTPDILIDHCPRIRRERVRVYCDAKNVPALATCKSVDNLSSKPFKKEAKCSINNGSSLQNLARRENAERYRGALSQDSYVSSQRTNSKHSYSIANGAQTPSQRRGRRSASVVPGAGVYRQISCDIENCKVKNESEVCAEGGWSHRGSLRGANKLARRARSFKDDLMERISNMRSPAQHHPPHLASNIRSHSPLSPKLRSAGAKAAAPDDGELTPTKELERLVKEVTFGLKHFSDVIAKRKLEMLPDNGTIVFESIANIHKAIKPYCSRSPPLSGAVRRLCAALATLIRLCDEVSLAHTTGIADGEWCAEGEMAGGVGGEEVPAARVAGVVQAVSAAVAEAVHAAAAHMQRPPPLSPRHPLVEPRPLSSAQRNSLPDIPLTPKERSLLTGEACGVGGAGGVRASHSSESVLDAPDPPPPKPARPNRRMELAPPLPPKRKSANDNSFLALSIDRLSLQSHSSGSLDSVLNVSNEDAHESFHNDQLPFVDTHNSESHGVCNCGSAGETRTSIESNDGHLNILQNNHNNRFSNESGFVSVGLSEISADHSYTSAFSSHQYSSHLDSTLDATDFVTESKCTQQSFEARMNFTSINSMRMHHSLGTKVTGLNSEENETPPELPAKTRRNIRADVQQHFPTVEIRQIGGCSLHGEMRPHTLADHHPPRPPPLPLKKKHIMAYMEMFGNCSHPPSAPVAPIAPQDMFRHSIHTYNLSSTQLNCSAVGVQRHQNIQKSIAQSFTVQHFGASPLSGSEDSVRTSSGTSPVPPEPPALPPKLNRNKQVPKNCSNELLPPASPRPSSHNSFSDDTSHSHIDVLSDSSFQNSLTPGKFPVEDGLDMQAIHQPTSPALSHRSKSPGGGEASEGEGGNGGATEGGGDQEDIILQTDVSRWLSLKAPGKEGPEVRGGQPDALIVLATKATKDFAYQEAFLATYRTWVSAGGLVGRLTRRAAHLVARPHDLRSTLSLLTRVVADLTISELDKQLMHDIMEFIYWLVDAEELAIAKALRQILVDKQKQMHHQQSNNRYEYECPWYAGVSARRDTLLDFKATELAEQMTMLDASLFSLITSAEVLAWPRDQSEDTSPNLTRFTEHFNKMSYWARSRILEQEESREREKLAGKLLKVMKALRKLNNYNSYLALVSALDSPPVRRLGWARAQLDALRDHCALIDSSCSFRAYRQALADTQPPCIPYIGLVLQDLTFVHIGNPDLLPDGSINFTKRWQQYHIMENMKRFQKDKQYKFKKNERILAMFNEFDDVLSEEAMWQISETIKPRARAAAHATALD